MATAVQTRWPGVASTLFQSGRPIRTPNTRPPRAIKHVSFEALLGLAAHHAPASYWDIVKRDNPRKGVQTMRPRRRKTATGTRQHGAPSALGADHDQPIKPVHPL